jgi:hypothetical protein
MTPNPKSVVPLNPAADTQPEAPTQRRPRPAAAAASSTPHSAFVPLLLGGLALLASLAFQTWLLTSERSALVAGHAGQQQTVDNAGKLRGQLDALAADTQRLADTGNPNAALLVAELKKRGITINAGASAAPATPAATPMK